MAIAIDTRAFEPPPWDAALDPQEYIEAIPREATVKGMFLQKIVDEATKAGIDPPQRGPYRAFRDYPLREALDLEIAVVPQMFPEVSLREGMRRLGWTAYPTLLDSMIGRVIFGVLGEDLPAIFKAAAKGYRVSVSIGRAHVIEVGTKHAVVRLEEVYNFPDCYQVGVFEGVFRHYQRTGTVECHAKGKFDIDILARW
jgi:uncharacterized protein (TIGR02265 family)